MTLGERIKKARKGAGFKSRDSFAEFLGSTRNALNEYEQGRVIPNDVFLQLMAAKLDISYDWLKYGAGKMHTGEKITPPLEGLDDDDRAIMMIYAELPPAHRKILKNFAVQVAATQTAKQKESSKQAHSATEKQQELAPPAPQSSDSDKPELDPEIEERIAKIRAQLYAREKTRRILTGSTDTANFSENEKSRP